MFEILDGGYAGRWFYRLQYYQPDEGRIIRYDNVPEDADLGKHHRRVHAGEDTEIAERADTDTEDTNQ